MATNQVVRYVITADAQKATRELSRSADAAEGVNRTLKGIAGAAAVFVAGAALNSVRQFVGDSVRAFSDLEQSVGGTEAVFGSTSAKIDEFAKKSATALGLSEAEFRTATTSIGGQLKRMTGDVDLAAEQSIELTQVAADLAATYGGTTAEAVAALGSAFRGEADPAERFNLNLKIGAQNAKAVELGLADTTSEVDDNARAQATLALIMEQSSDAQGQFAREQDTVAGQAQITAAQLENQKALVGETLQAYKEWGNFLQLEMGKALGHLALGIQVLTGNLTEGAAALKDYEIATGHTVDSMETLAEVIGTASREAEGIGFWQDLFDNTKESADRMVRDLPDLIDGLDLTTTELLDAVKGADSLAHQMGLTEEETRIFKEALRTELAEALRETDKNFGRSGGAAGRWRQAQEEAASGSGEALERWKTKLQSAAEAHDKFRDDVLNDLNEVVTGFDALPEEADVGLQEWIDNMNDRLAEYRTWHANLATLTEAGMTDFVAEMAEAGFEGSHQLVQQAVDSLNAGDGLARVANEAAASAKNVGELIAQGMALGIDENAADIIAAAEAAVRRAVNAAQSEARIESPSKLFAEEVGKPIAEGIAEGIKGSDAPGAALAGMVGGMASGAPSGGGFGGGIVINLPNYLGDKAEVARIIRDELVKLQRRNGTTGI